jgi:hypothetical protein
MLDFAYISRTFPSDPRLSFLENEAVSALPPISLRIDDCELLIGTYKPHEK